MRRQYFVAIVMLNSALGCTSTSTVVPPAPTNTADIKPEVAAEIETLLGLIGSRLLIMHDVARWKLQEGLPITDSKREQAVIEQTREFAREKGLDVDLAASFMAAQIEAGKQIQQLDLDAWRTSGVPDPQPSSDLAKELRPKIDHLSQALVTRLSRLAPHLAEAGVQKVLRGAATDLSQQHGLDAKACDTALAPLLER